MFEIEVRDSCEERRTGGLFVWNQRTKHRNSLRMVEELEFLVVELVWVFIPHLSRRRSNGGANQRSGVFVMDLEDFHCFREDVFVESF